MLVEIESFAKWLRRKSPHTSTAVHYTNDLELFFAWIDKPPDQITLRDVDAFIEHSQQQGHRIATVNRRLAALRSFYHFLEIENDDARPNPVRPKRHFIRQGRRLPRDAQDAEIEKLFAVISDLRDRAMFLLMLRCGLRVGEVRALSLNDLYLQPTPGSLPRLWIQGKGGSQRVAYLSAQPLVALKAWLAIRPTVEEQAVFLNRFGTRFTVTGIQLRLAEYCHAADHATLAHGRRCIVTISTGKRPPHIKNTTPTHPEVKRIIDWFPPNRNLYLAFRVWLYWGGYASSARNAYCVAARLALGLLDKPYWKIDVSADLDQIRAFIATHYTSAATRREYGQGLDKFAAYLNIRCRRPTPEPPINWEYYLSKLPDSLATDLRAYVQHCRRNWRPDQVYRSTYNLLGVLTRALRWMAAQVTLQSAADITPQIWFAYVDARLANHIQPVTLNHELQTLQNFLRFLADQERNVCVRMFRVKPLDMGPRLPRDAPLEQLRRLLTEIEKEIAAPRARVQRMAVMDRAWFLLMLHSGLRTSEVRHLQLADIDWENRRVRIEQSKGLKDRLVCLSDATLEALKTYLAVRGPASTEYAFIYRHLPLGSKYCQIRLRTYGKRCGVSITPHQLRHSCATLLLNAGAPILTVQTILGHQRVDTTLGYARLYDGTVAADYYRAMLQVEHQMALPEDAVAEPPNSGQLLALVDALRSGTLNESQQETVRVLRAGIVALAERGSAS